MVMLEDRIKIEKTFPKPGEAINFQKNILVRLHDQYKSECGPWIDVFIYGVQLKHFFFGECSNDVFIISYKVLIVYNQFMDYS